MGHLQPSFLDDVAIVTGAASGIGLAVTCALSRAGARVYGFDVTAPDAETLDVDDHPPIFCEVDVRDTSAIEAAVADILGREGRIDLLVQAAGSMVFRQRRPVGVHTDDPDGRILLLKVPARSGNGPAGPGCGNKMRDPAFGLLPDLRTCRFVVTLSIGHIVELIGPHRAVGLFLI